MLKKAIKKHIRRHHPWRTIKFDELAEIYISMTLRSFGFSAIGVFVPIYLYKSGVGLSSVLLFLFYFFALRLLVAPVAGRIVGRIGPKHGIAISNVLFIAFLSTLLTYEYMHWPLIFLSFMYTMANGMFFVAYHTDFSKIKHASHGGKELGWLYIFERVGSALGPVVGGLLAGFFDPQVTILFAITIIFASLIPLFLTNEPVKVHQHITFKGFDWRSVTKSDGPALGSFNIVNLTHAALWPLFIGVFVFTDNTYEALGVIVGLSMLVSMISARLFGRLVDKKHGTALLKYGTWTTMLVNLSRIFAVSPASATIVSTLSEPTELASKMALVKAYYDESDSHEGYRIVYIVTMEMVTSVGKSLFMLAGWAAIVLLSNDKLAFQLLFFATAIIGFGMLKQSFPALKEKVS